MIGPDAVLTDRLRAALRLPDDADTLAARVEAVDESLVVRVDSVDRRYRDAIKAGARPVEPPRDDIGLGACRRLARLADVGGTPVTIWSPGL